MCKNPLEDIRMCIATALNASLDGVRKGFEIPREEFGDIAIILTKAMIEKNSVFLNNLKSCELVAQADLRGIYLNIFLDRERFARKTLEYVTSYDDYGVCREEKEKNIVVEYVSANPIHPLHIGAARNAALGSFIIKILKAFGNNTQARFYINDAGRQVATVALGFKLLKNHEKPANVKPDHWVGLIYAITNTVAEIQKIKKSLEKADEENMKKLREELDELMADAAKLWRIAPDAFNEISEGLKNIDFEEEISKIMRSYEEKEPSTVALVRRIINMCLNGFMETLKRFGVEIDVWDWESDLIWSGEVEKILSELRRKATTYKGTLAVDFRSIDTEEVRERLGIEKELEIPPLVIQRSNGTTLYTIRDIAYTLKKFREFNADKVINVIASEQKLPQAQLRLALYMLGYTKEAENLMHYSYEIVNVEGMKMSSRRGRIVTLDEIIDEAKKRVLMELEKRGGGTEEVAEKIGVAAIKFYLLSVSPSRPVKFSWDAVLNFERNSAPYLLYTYARTEGIFRKAKELGLELNWAKLLQAIDKRFVENNRRWRLVKLVALFPDTVYKSYRELDPSPLAIYTLRLADEFNAWYDEEPIVLEKDEKLRSSKILLVHAVNKVLKKSLQLLGIEPLEKM
ncbi:arginine--tRNA ligase [Ignisphaera sp. 4213-co]|uniref:Arginine--tRNA ligase n=1 Tax=Ignisphaera cupida TaxID=3050454 RepID=A0ABD4Z680_9CREN|nr:arginine--tRNA ligase [Ignisphaera sp. 4213-co]MDK6028438.1 arginine--tRNA ligase [Ignisphaera sp. 4213-co]